MTIGIHQPELEALYGLTLLTRNVKDFAGTGVPILNPWDEPELSVE